MVDHGEVDMSRVPILVILGSTGCGKTRLSIELARRFSGEIISADSMQVYKGLDIVTAKVTKDEREMAPHHMLDVVDPLNKFTVLEFRDMTLPIIDDLLARKKLPIIAGGTNYYIESLLWNVLITDPIKSADQKGQSSENRSAPTTDSKISDETNQELDYRNEEREKDGSSSSKKMKTEYDRNTEESNEELHRKLSEVDPEMAKRLHPNNRRKVIRSLEVFAQHGVTHSELLKAQRIAGDCGLGGPLRHPNSIILWLRCETKVLHERLESRVDTMLDTGLVEELLDFHRRYNEERIKSHTSPDYTKGIFQTIGFKEFHAYLVLPEDERRSEKGQALLKKSIEDLKVATNRYAKKQERWIMNRLIRRSDRQVPPVYTLDCTNVEQWNNRVLETAESIVSAVLRGETPEQTPLNENVQNNKVRDSSNEESYYCEVCERLFIGDLQWNAHIKGMKHMKVLKKKERIMENAENRELRVA